MQEIITMPQGLNQVYTNDGNIFQSDFHTLIIEDIQEEYIPLFGEDGLPLENFFERIPPFRNYKLFVSDFDDGSIHGWNKIKNLLMGSYPEDTLELHISSYGGNTTEGIELYNIINSAYKNRSTAYLNYGFSMGALTFLMCSERIIYEDSEIMFHNWMGGFRGKAADIESHFGHTKRYLRRFFHKLLSPYFSDKEIKKIEKGKEVWLDAKDMMNRGIATGIVIDGEYFPREEYFKKYNKKGKVRKSWIKKQKEEAKKQKEQEEVLVKALEEVTEANKSE
jgi:ATP-dependent Clp protease protease subunit